MTKRRVHVAKVPTDQKNPDLFLYSHYDDRDHNPFILARSEGDRLELICADVFKLKPNVQSSPRIRIDLYVPGQTALELGGDILDLFGSGEVAELAGVDPNDFRRGQQTLPHIDEKRRVEYSSAQVDCGGFTVFGEKGTIFLDKERPREGHIEMVGPEVHLGIPLDGVDGSPDNSKIRRESVPEDELRVGDETNPIRKADGRIRVMLSAENARALSATLLSYVQD